jgi:hypothetical protein
MPKDRNTASETVRWFARTPTYPPYLFSREECLMKFWKALAVLLLVGMVAVACSEQNRTVGEVDQPQQPGQTEQQPITQAVEETQQGPAELAGIVMETEKGVTLVTDTDTYLVAGQDLSGMVGKRIKVTGTITTAEESQILEVLTVIPLE